LVIFAIFAIFGHNFANIVAPPSDKNENYVDQVKVSSILKKSENRIKIDQQIVTQYMFTASFTP